MKPVAVTVLVFIAITACAAPIHRYVAFPTRGQTPDQVERDKQECQQIAESHRSGENLAAGAAIGTGGGAAAGALIGAVQGAFFGQPGYGAGYGAATGASTGLIAGITAGATADWQRYHNIYIACMLSRGYMLGG